MPIDENQPIVDDFLRNLFESTSEEIYKHHQLRQVLKCNHSLSESFESLSSKIYLPKEIDFTIDSNVELLRTRGHLVIKEGLNRKSQQYRE